jgi:phage terminase large subunit-like protein
MNYNPVVMDYCEDVLAGRVVTGRYVRLAVERHLRDLEDGKSRGLYFNHQAGQRVIDFFSRLNHHKGEKAKTPILLEPNQQFYLYTLFGWMQEGGLRRFFKSYKEVARKNGKTTECAGKGMYTALLDNEQGAQVYFVATKEEQARIGFDDVWKIIRATPRFEKTRTYANGSFEVWKKSVTVPHTGAFIKPVGSDSDTQDGFDPHHAIVDEYHAHKTDGMINVMESGMGARRQPLIDIITTAGFNKELPCYGFRKMCVDMLEGRVDNDSLYALIFALDDEDLQDTNWQNEDVWIKANPNLGASVYVRNLRSFAKEARDRGGEKEVDFKTKNLNIWTDAADTWIPDEVWQKGASHFNEESLRGMTCYGGLDLAIVNDFSALALTFPLESGKFKTIYRFWIPEDTVQKRIDRGLSSLRNWINDGYVTATEGNVTDFDVIERDIIELSEKYNIEAIGADRNLASQLINNLIKNGLNMQLFAQSVVGLSQPTKEYERCIRAALIDHGHNPVMRWMIGNVAIKRYPEGNIKVDKDKSSEKVDGVVADIMAWGTWNTECMGESQEIEYKRGDMFA